MVKAAPSDCTFCDIVAGRASAACVYQDAEVYAFLDRRPVKKGHVLLVPRAHCSVLADLPAKALAGYFSVAQRLCAAVEQGLDAEGSFVGINNRVSQSVPHLHTHVIPRRRGDGLRGFFWPRTVYASSEEAEDFRARIAQALKGGS